MPIDVGVSNTSRYYSVPGSSDFDLPNDDWVWLYVGGFQVSDYEYAVSTQATWGGSNSCNIYTDTNSNGISMRVHSLPAVKSGVSTPVGDPIIIRARRRAGSLNVTSIGVLDRGHEVQGGNVAVSAAYPNTNGLRIGHRMSGTGAHYLDGKWYHALYMPYADVTLADMRAFRDGRPLETFPWYKKCVFHAAPVNSDDPQLVDLTGRHVLTRQGTSYGLDTDDDTAIRVKAPRDLRRIYRPLYGTPPPVSDDVLNRGLSGIEQGVVASTGGGHSGLHSIDSGYVAIEGEAS